MAELFQASLPDISMHVKNVFDEVEFQLDAIVQDFLTVRQEAERKVQRTLTYYNLDGVIFVGYRVKSLLATHLLSSLLTRLNGRCLT
ncbi:MAG: RhuM family protein [Gallionella sp.]